jgi:hypothetical protein
VNGQFLGQDPLLVATVRDEPLRSTADSRGATSQPTMKRLNTSRMT